MNNKIVMIRKWVLTILLAMAIGSVLILMINENPLDAYAALIKGAFNGKLKFGTTLASFTPLLLTSTAFAVAAKGGAFDLEKEFGLPAKWVRSMDRSFQLAIAAGILALKARTLCTRRFWGFRQTLRFFQPG